MASTRAPAVAEVLWELKRADKVAKYAVIAARAGFNAGTNGRAMDTCLKTVRKDWPHLDWWRAIPDNLVVLKDDGQAEELRAWGAEVAAQNDNKKCTVVIDESRMMVWGEVVPSQSTDIA